MKSVILCDVHGNETGEYSKLEAHQENLLHKAFSVVIYNSRGEMLIHKRADCKYHTPGLWTNACCSHHVPGESVYTTAPARLQEEMGFSCSLEQQHTFLYQADFNNGLYEHELDTVFVGLYDGPIDAYNPREVSSARWVGIEELMQEIKENPERFTPWFHLIVERLHGR